MLTTVSTAAIKKYGMVRITSLHLILPRCHQAIASRIIGKVATEPLLSIDNKNADRLNKYQADDRARVFPPSIRR